MEEGRIEGGEGETRDTWFSFIDRLALSMIPLQELLAFYRVVKA